MNQKIILVTGATGQQGGSVMKHLMEKGCPLRILVRDPKKPMAISLEERGVEIRKGNFDDLSSLALAMKGVYGVFSVQQSLMAGVENEIQQGKAVADVAKAEGVKHFVYSSVGGAERNTGIPHFDSKWEVEKHIQSLELPATILRPVFFMDNFNTFYGQQIEKGILSQALHPDTKLQMIAVGDIGFFASLAFENAEEYIGKAMEIAGDELTMVQIANILEQALAQPFLFEEQPMEELQKFNKEYALMYQWFIDKGYKADIPKLRSLYPALMNFETWVRKMFRNLPFK